MEISNYCNYLFIFFPVDNFLKKMNFFAPFVATSSISIAFEFPALFIIYLYISSVNIGMHVPTVQSVWSAVSVN